MHRYVLICVLSNANFSLRSQIKPAQTDTRSVSVIGNNLILFTT